MRRYLSSLCLAMLLVLAACSEKKEAKGDGKPGAKGETFVGGKDSKDVKPIKSSDMIIDTDRTQTADFPGGFQAMCDYLKAHVQMPDVARKQKWEGKVVVEVLVDAQGKVAKCHVKSSDNAVFNDEAVRVIEAMPRFTPAHKGGKAVESTIEIIVPFRL